MKTELEKSSAAAHPVEGAIKIKQEQNVAFSVEEVVPVWAKELKDDFTNLRNKVDDLVLTDSETL